MSLPFDMAKVMVEKVHDGEVMISVSMPEVVVKAWAFKTFIV